MLLLPNLIMFTSLESDMANNEKHGVQSLELSGSILENFQSLKIFYKGNFGLKKTLTSQYLNVKQNLLKESPIPHKVVVGKEKEWYFLGDDFSGAFSGSNGVSQYSQKELDKIVNSIQDINNWLTSQDIAFYLAIPPNKHTIYKEHLPFSYNVESKYDVVLNKLRQETNINVIDLKTPLLKAKDSIQVYHKTDSHWNDTGSFIGYQTVMNRLNQDFNQLSGGTISDYQISKQKRKHQEMTRMINLDVYEQVKLYNPKASRATVVSNSDRLSHFQNDSKPLSIYFCRDSFSNAWMKYFNESFGNVVYAKTYRINKKEILKYKPDIVILEFVERKFDYFLKYKNPILY